MIFFINKMWNPADLLWNFGLLGVTAVDNNSSCQACPKGTFANNSEYSLLHVLLVILFTEVPYCLE